tara:strand:+ start:14896 stop:16080 length:1185 start_codon:yes stop_codon:yes gene_type:complete
LKKTIYFISFFIYSGFYAVLALLISLGMIDFSRNITVPLRLLTTLLMIYILFKIGNIFKKETSATGLITIVFYIFWILYFFKVLFHYAYDYPLERNWFEYIFYPINYTILPFLLFSNINFHTYKNTILDSVIFSGFALGLVSVYLYGNILFLGAGRISMAKYIDPSITETLSPLALSYAGALTLALCFYKIVFKRRELSKAKLFYLIFTIIMAAIMFLLGASRGSVFALFTSLILLLIYTKGSNFSFLILSLLLVVPVLIWGAITTGSSVFTRVFDTIENRSISERELLWVDAWNEFIKNPILGGRIEIDFYPHNIYLEVLMSTGITGFLLFSLILYFGLRKVHKLSFKSADYIWVYIILVQGMSHHLFSGAIYFSILVFFPLGLVYSKKRKIL